MIYDPPVQLAGPEVTVGWMYTNDAGTVIALEPDLGDNDGTFGWTGQLPGLPKCGLIFGGVVFPAFSINMLCLGEPPLGACCDVSPNQPSGGACDRLPQIDCLDEFQRWLGGEVCLHTCEETGVNCETNADCLVCKGFDTPCATSDDCRACTGIAAIEGAPCVSAADCRVCDSGLLQGKGCTIDEDCFACSGIPSVEGQACSNAADCMTCADWGP